MYICLSKINAMATTIANTETICALATPAGVSAIGIIRVSGPETFSICEKLLRPLKKSFRLSTAPTHTLHLMQIFDEGEMLDEVLVSIFRAPHSYTGEDSIELSCHGSLFIEQKIIELLIKNGIRLAHPGEYTMRAFLNGKLDLSQAEAVADLIASQSKAAHDIAINQMRGGFTQKLHNLRHDLVNFATWINLELDFSEEDVEFADRKEIRKLLHVIKDELTKLTGSFSLGNVLKNGIPVAIVGKPNVGKSTLLNAILNEERAIVSEIPGTTRDTIEDTLVIEGVAFRFIDTAGLHPTQESVESMGIERTYQAIEQASIILYMIDINETSIEDINEALLDFKEHLENKSKRFIIIANKTDLLVETPHHFSDFVELETIFISAKRKENIKLIIESLLTSVDTGNFENEAIISNARHYEALHKAFEAMENVEKGLDEHIPTDLLSTDIKMAIHYIGEITGEVTTDEILSNIFGKFCIGK